MKNEQFLAYNSRSGEFESTEQRPEQSELKILRQEMKEKDKHTKLHSPGDGWHYLPGPDLFVFGRSKQWFAQREDSAGCIYAHLNDICFLIGFRFDELWNRAYSDIDVPEITDDDRVMCTRPATLNDVQAIVDDLGDINAHSLAGELEKLIVAGLFDS